MYDEPLPELTDDGRKMRLFEADPVILTIGYVKRDNKVIEIKTQFASMDGVLDAEVNKDEEKLHPKYVTAVLQSFKLLTLEKMEGIYCSCRRQQAIPPVEKHGCRRCNAKDVFRDRRLRFQSFSLER